MQNNSPNPWLRLVRAARYSVAGLRAAYRYEQAFRQEVLILLLVVPLALWLGEGGIQYALMIGSWLLVMVVELLNSGDRDGGGSYRPRTPRAGGSGQGHRLGGGVDRDYPGDCRLDPGAGGLGLVTPSTDLVDGKMIQKLIR